MTAPFAPPLVVVDLLTQATAYVTRHLDRSLSVSDRLRNLWAAVVASRDLGAADVVEDEFLRLARDAGLAADLGHPAAEDLRHVIRWGILDQNPFQWHDIHWGIWAEISDRAKQGRERNQFSAQHDPRHQWWTTKPDRFETRWHARFTLCRWHNPW
jgi:hypothetical protein